jgi:hypothetical protein
VSAIETTVFAVAIPSLDEGHAVPRHPADERVRDPGEILLREQKAVTALAGVLDVAGADSDLMNDVAGQAAQIANPLVELPGGLVRVGVHRQEQRMPAADTGVFVVTGASAGADVGVMAEEASQHMTRMSDPAVLEEERLAATSAPWAAIGGDRSVVDLMADDGA